MSELTRQFLPIIIVIAILAIAYFVLRMITTRRARKKTGADSSGDKPMLIRNSLILLVLPLYQQYKLST